MSVYILSSRVISVENSVDELGRKVVSTNAVFTGTTTLIGLVVFNGAVAFGSSICGYRYQRRQRLASVPRYESSIE